MFGTLIADPPWSFDDKKSGMVKTGKGAESHYPCLPLGKILSFLDDTLLQGTNLPISECIADKAHLWLWVPNAFIIEGTGAKVARAWGFEPKTLVTWCKGRLAIEWVKPEGGCKVIGRGNLSDAQFKQLSHSMDVANGPAVPRAKIVAQIGQGTWIRNNTEQVLFCVRGKAPPAVRNLPSSFVHPGHEEDVWPDEYFWAGRDSQHSRKPDTIHRWAEMLSPGPRLELFARRPVADWVTMGDQAPAVLPEA